MNNDDILSLPRLVAAIKRELKLIGICVGSFFVLAILYSIFTTAKYTANTSILMDPAQADTVAEISSKAKSRFEDAAIVSQIELIKSRRVAQKVAEYLSLDKSEDGKPLEADEHEALIEAVGGGLRVFREGQSYVLTIKYTATDPDLAADYANAYAKAYIYDQINSFSEDSVKTSEWLKSKIAELRQESIEANLEVQKFRRENNLIKAGGNSVNEQQLSSINDRLSDAKAEVATARVKYLHSKEIVENKNISAAVAEAFDNDVINNIRTQYLEDQKKLLGLSRTLGASHKTVRDLRKKVAESKNVIFTEMKRISESYKNDYEVALAKESSLKESLDKLVGVQLDNDGQSFELQALEKEAESYAKLHDEYLKKYETIQQQQTFPVSGSRIITKAVPPLSKSHPKIIVILGLALIFGGGVGVLLALLKDNFDATFKRAGQIENLTSMHFLGFFPTFEKQNISGPKASDFLDSAFSQSVDVPLSLQAETCRNIKMTANRKLEANCKVMAITADSPHMGKSVVAGNLAQYIAQSGAKCLLVDADLRNPVLSEQNFVSIDAGLSSVLTKQNDLQTAVLQDSKTGLYVLPARKKGKATAADLISGEYMKDLIESAKADFDFIIIDLPALSVTADASFSTVFIDYFLLVLEWGKSKPNHLNFQMKVSDIPEEKVLGVILGQADMEEMAKNYGHKLDADYTSKS